MSGAERLARAAARRSRRSARPDASRRSVEAITAAGHEDRLRYWRTRGQQPTRTVRYWPIEWLGARAARDRAAIRALTAAPPPDDHARKPSRRRQGRGIGGR